jgi:hypothetical protein
MKRILTGTKKIPCRLCLATLTLCLACSAFARDDKDNDNDKDKDKDKAAGAPARREQSMRASVTAKVIAINPEKREITLRGSEGKEKTITVDKAVQRFNEIKVGDEVKADYYVSLAGEVREATDEEKEHPLTDVTIAGKSPAGEDPAAGGARMVKAVTKVESLDPDAKTITIKGPRGRTADVAIKDPATFEKLKKGDTIVITYTEALAVSLEKQSPKE